MSSNEQKKDQQVKPQSVEMESKDSNNQQSSADLQKSPEIDQDQNLDSNLEPKKDDELKNKTMDENKDSNLKNEEKKDVSQIELGKNQVNEKESSQIDPELKDNGNKDPKIVKSHTKKKGGKESSENQHKQDKKERKKSGEFFADVEGLIQTNILFRKYIKELIVQTNNNMIISSLKDQILNSNKDFIEYLEKGEDDKGISENLENYLKVFNESMLIRSLSVTKKLGVIFNDKNKYKQKLEEIQKEINQMKEFQIEKDTSMEPILEYNLTLKSKIIRLAKDISSSLLKVQNVVGKPAREIKLSDFDSENIDDFISTLDFTIFDQINDKFNEIKIQGSQNRAQLIDILQEINNKISNLTPKELKQHTLTNSNQDLTQLILDRISRIDDFDNFNIQQSEITKIQKFLATGSAIKHKEQNVPNHPNITCFNIDEEENLDDKHESETKTIDQESQSLDLDMENLDILAKQKIVIKNLDSENQIRPQDISINDKLDNIFNSVENPNICSFSNNKNTQIFEIYYCLSALQEKMLSLSNYQHTQQDEVKTRLERTKVELESKIQELQKSDDSNDSQESLINDQTEEPIIEKAEDPKIQELKKQISTLDKSIHKIDDSLKNCKSIHKRVNLFSNILTTYSKILAKKHFETCKLTKNSDLNIENSDNNGFDLLQNLEDFTPNNIIDFMYKREVELLTKKNKKLEDELDQNEQLLSKIKDINFGSLNEMQSQNNAIQTKLKEKEDIISDLSLKKEKLQLQDSSSLLIMTISEENEQLQSIILKIRKEKSKMKSEITEKQDEVLSLQEQLQKGKEEIHKFVQKYQEKWETENTKFQSNQKYYLSERNKYNQKIQEMEALKISLKIKDQKIEKKEFDLDQLINKLKEQESIQNEGQGVQVSRNDPNILGTRGPFNIDQSGIFDQQENSSIQSQQNGDINMINDSNIMISSKISDIEKVQNISIVDTLPKPFNTTNSYLRQEGQTSFDDSTILLGQYRLDIDNQSKENEDLKNKLKLTENQMTKIQSDYERKLIREHTNSLTFQNKARDLEKLRIIEKSKTTKLPNAYQLIILLFLIFISKIIPNFNYPNKSTQSESDLIDS